MLPHDWVYRSLDESVRDRELIRLNSEKEGKPRASGVRTNFGKSACVLTEFRAVTCALDACWKPFMRLQTGMWNNVHT